MLIKTYYKTSTILLLQNNLKKVKFFKEIFLLVNINLEVILRISFLSFGNIDIEFARLKRLTLRFYDTIEALPIIYQIQLIDKKKFAHVMLDENADTFVIYLAMLKAKALINLL